MKREEAIRYCDEYLARHISDIDKEFLKIAKEALQQKPCTDAISRQAVLDILKEKWNMFSDANDAIQESIDTIEALQPVTPQPRVGHSFPKEATNKDIFKAIFGYEPATDSVVCNKEDWCGASEPCNYCLNNSNSIGREEDWWNAPYKKAESEEKEK